MIALDEKIYFKNKKSTKINNKILSRYFIKLLSLFLLFFLFVLFQFFQNVSGVYNNIKYNNHKYNNNKYNKNKTMNFCCFVGVAKLENLYARDLVQHYLSIGFEKFYLGDDNFIGSEKLSDVLQDYMDEGIVEILDIRGKNWTQEYFYQYAFDIGKKDCKWMAFYDFDEQLEFNNKSMNIKSYLSMKQFNKCDVVKIHWLMFYDNDLVHYDNRTLKERFTKPAYNSIENRFHKSIVRAKNYSGILWSSRTGPHQPKEELVNMCDAVGNLANVPHGILGTKNYKYGHLNHYTRKTIEEFIQKIKKGHFQGTKFNYQKRLKIFFTYDKYTPEKAQVVEKLLNITPEKLQEIIHK